MHLYYIVPDDFYLILYKVLPAKKIMKMDPTHKNNKIQNQKNYENGSNT